MTKPDTSVSENGAAVSDKLDRAVFNVAAVVVLGSIMAIVVNVALQELTLQFRTSFDTIQWVSTGYMLTLAAVILVTGWASDRFGTKRLYFSAISLFLLGSVLSGLAWSVETLIVFRLVQGLGDGMLMPAGMTLLARAGPQRAGQVMALLGVPMLLGPIGGPILGSWPVGAVSWRWIFYINVPIGLMALWLTAMFLAKDKPERTSRFNFAGMLMLSPGLALLLYGVANVPGAVSVTAVNVWLPGVLGAVLIIGFLLRTTRVSEPLIDLGLFRDRGFSVAVLTMAFFSVSFLGVMLLFPTYFLLAPQGIGVLITMPIGGERADKFGAGKVVLLGIGVIVLGLILFTTVGADTPYWQLPTAVFVIGLGVGAAMMPIMVAALQTLSHKDVAKGATATNITQQLFGAVGAAVMSIVLASVLAQKFGVPTSQGQPAAIAALANPDSHQAAATATAESFATTFTWALVLMIVCAIPAVLLPRRAPATDRSKESGTPLAMPTH
jgi:EmrB/QacA subfamily drug resistance transporter